MIDARCEILVQTTTPFQEVTVARLPQYGKCLFLDGDLQSAELDQDLYHNALVRPVFKYNPRIKTALILGGGEGATAKKVLEGEAVERVTMVDIDEELVNICAEYLPEWGGKIRDPRLSIHYQDAGRFVRQDNHQYDLIVWDLVDPYYWQDGTPTAASDLYTRDFFECLRDHLADDGLLSIEYAHRNRKRMSDLLKGWTKVMKREVYIPSFEEKWTFALMV